MKYSDTNVITKQYDIEVEHGAGRVAEVVEHLLSKHEAPSSNPIPPKNKVRS
jgi:hypothetical protein